MNASSRTGTSSRSAAWAPPVACLAALIALFVLAAPADATFPGANGKIAFTTNRDGNFEIYSMNADGSSQTNITNNPADDLYPRWSPDGTKLAFQTNRDGNYEIYTMNADGSGQTRLTNNPANDQVPAWSPDGTKIAFQTNRDGTQQIYVMNADGTGQTRLTNNTANDQYPAWSPDGTKIAFTSDRTGRKEIFTMNADGTSQTQITNSSCCTGEYAEVPDWSPDGTKIAFERFVASGRFDICWRYADGSAGSCYNLHPSFADAGPRFSPDGTELVFESNQDTGGTNYQIYTTTFPFSGSETRLTNNTAFDDTPDWQPMLRNYARPRGATPTRISLTPAYKPCTAPNTTHKAPLSFPSCLPPKPTSSFLTVGTPDFNGQGAQSIGSALFNVRTAAPEDILIDVNMTDVRCAGVSGGCGGGPTTPYTGALRFDTTFRVTDKGNNPGGVNPSATVLDLPLRFGVPCAPAGAGVGSTCSISTTINAQIGASAIVAGQRAIWQLNGDVKLWDGGTPGIATAADATLFAVGGLFAP